MAGSHTVGLAIIGDEVLTGEVRDENLHWIASELFRLGSDLKYVCVLPDDPSALRTHLRLMKERFDWVITTGGIGATHDDVTRQAVADVFGVPLEENAEAVALLEGRTGKNMKPKVREMALLPRGVELIKNPLTAAPGFVLENVIVLPGIPRLIRAMFPALADRLSGAAWHRREIAIDRSEADIAASLEHTQADFPDVKMGSYPVMTDGGFRVRLVLRSRSKERIDEAADILKRRIDLR